MSRNLASVRRGAQRRRESRGLPGILALLAVLVIGGCGKRDAETIVVGSKNFTEQIVLAELFAQQIEAHSALHVETDASISAGH